MKQPKHHTNKTHVSRKKDKSNKLSTAWLASLLSVCLILIPLTTLVANSMSLSKTLPQGQATESATNPIGVTFSTITYDDVGIPPVWIPGEGQQFVMIELTVANKSGEVFHFSPVAQLMLTDSSGKTYEVTSAPKLINGLGGPIDPGVTLTGQVGFTVPKNVENLRLTYTSKNSQEIINLP